MNIADLLELLLETTIAASAALLLVMLVRRPLRNAFGAAVAYAAWALVPAAVIAVLLPASTVAVELLPVAVTSSASAAPMTAVQAVTPIDVTGWLFVMWLTGVVVMVLHLGRQQRAFRRGLGRLQSRVDGLQQAESIAGLPAALGLLRPTIVVPSDFDTRYSSEQRRLMRAHERSHIVRGDLHINALVAALRSVFWFNPLLHYATRHFRHDQELACDQRVIKTYPNARRAYGEAMFKTQLAAQQPLPLGCHWGYSHPLKERIAMLKQPVPTVSRWIGGSALVLALAVGVGFTAWSAQPKREVVTARDFSAGMLLTRMEVSIDAGKPQQFDVVSKAGEPFVVRTEPAGQQWEMHATATPLSNGTIAVDSTLSRNGEKMGSPKLVVHEGKKAAIKIGEENVGDDAFEGLTLEMMVTAAAPPVPPTSPTPPAAIAPPATTAAVHAVPPVPALPPRPKAGIAPPPPPPHALPELAPPALPTPRSKTHIAPPAPPATPKPAMSSPMTNPPKYPAGLAKLGVSGNVVLQVDVSAEGNPTSIEVVESAPAGLFDATAIEAARKWKFQPTMENGKPVAGRVRVPVEFKAPKAKAPSPAGTI
ncbi:MAG: TonB family protein [Lysobacter sp.]